MVTCAATSGYMIEYDNRHLWMKLKTIKGRHFANYREAWEANRLDVQGPDPADPVDQCTRCRRWARRRPRCTHNLHEGKIGVLCLSPEEGLGMDDPEFRAKVGEDKITAFRRLGA